MLSAAAADPSIKEISRPIIFEGKELGTVRLGVTVVLVNQRVSEMQSRFNKLISDSGVKVKDALHTVAEAINKGLQANFALVNEQSAESSSDAQQTIEMSACKLLWTQVGSMSVLGILILTALCMFFVLRVVLPINRLKTTMQDIAAGEGDLTQRLQD
ncbi:MAG: hypothetical protein KZQ66_06775 [Candidatus Thiodiazotropha sp. (ex Lucinoma aequizonata)]|nr:hypothetical protein [Candidatus Thiodiazotropha sp. (ex Lucinoma aequizonata)]